MVSDDRELVPDWTNQAKRWALSELIARMLVHAAERGCVVEHIGLSPRSLFALEREVKLDSDGRFWMQGAKRTAEAHTENRLVLRREDETFVLTFKDPDLW